MMFGTFEDGRGLPCSVVYARDVPGASLGCSSSSGNAMHGVEGQEEGGKGAMGWGMCGVPPLAGHQLVSESILLAGDIQRMHVQPVVEQDELRCVRIRKRQV